MKKNVRLICAAGVLAASGCVFERDHDHGSQQFHDDHAGGGDHGEYPGDGTISKIGKGGGESLGLQPRVTL